MPVNVVLSGRKLPHVARDYGSAMRRTRFLAIVIATIGLLSTTLALFPVRASDPPSHDLIVPSKAGQTVSVSWTGTIPPGTSPQNSCSSSPSPNDPHDINLAVPDGLYQGLVANFEFKITWDPVTPDETTSDEVLTVLDPNG